MKCSTEHEIAEELMRGVLDGPEGWLRGNVKEISRKLSRLRVEPSFTLENGEVKGVAGEPVRAVPDQPGTEQWRGLHVGVALAKNQARVGASDSVLRISTVDGVPREPGVDAEVFTPGTALLTGSVDVRNPRDTETIGGSETSTPGPTALTRPTTWWPMTSGSFGWVSSPSTT